MKVKARKETVVEISISVEESEMLAHILGAFATDALAGVFGCGEDVNRQIKLADDLKFGILSRLEKGDI